MFDKHHEKKAEKEYEEALTKWQAERDAYAELLQLATGFAGSATDAVMLAAGEALFCTVRGASLIEERAGKGHWQGASAGVSVPIGSVGGRPVRYRVGGTRGHYVQGTPAPTAIDHGTVYITNRRVIFSGTRQTRECAFAKLIGFEHDDKQGSTTFAVSNRQKPTTIHYGPGIADWFDFRLDLALAHSRGTIGALVHQLQQDLTQIDAIRPVAPPAPAQ
ncbi:MAG TPA: hypothetical protein VME46_17110 [Acidimicrobiales bacterium]|nr:hypothetical protein [Acidimicrobiales bacterium]